MDLQILIIESSLSLEIRVDVYEDIVKFYAIIVYRKSFELRDKSRW